MQSRIAIPGAAHEATSQCIHNICNSRCDALYAVSHSAELSGPTDSSFDQLVHSTF